MSKKFFAFKGDRFLCLKGRDDVISSLPKKETWEIKTFSENITVSKLVYSANSKEIFGSKNKLYIFDNVIPSPEDEMATFLQSLPNSRKVIFLLDEKGTLDKRTKLGKFLSEELIEYPSMFNDKGYLDQKQIKSAKKTIRSIAGWSGSEDCLDYILEKTDYQYGAILNEVEKIEIFLEKHPQTLEEIKDIVCENDLIRMDNIFEKIKERDLISSLELFQDILDSNNFRDCYMMFFMGLLDTFYFMLYCKMANDSGYTSLDEMAEFVAENYKKGNKVLHPQAIKGRYFYSKDHLKLWTTSDLQFAIKEIEKSINVSMLGTRSDRFVVENFLVQII